MKSFMKFMFTMLLLSNNFYAGQGLSDLMIVDESNIDEQIAIAVQVVYDATQNEFNKVIALFTHKLILIVESLGAYVDQAAQEFDVRCDKELKNAIEQMNKIARNSSKAYYDALKKIGISYGVGVTDPIAQQLYADISSIENNIINEMRASVAILKSRDTLPAIGQEITSGVDMFQQIAHQEYVNAQTKAMDVPKTTWWKDLKASGTQFLGIFQADLEAQCEVEMHKASDKLVKNLTKEATKQGTGYAKSLVAPSKDATKNKKGDGDENK